MATLPPGDDLGPLGPSGAQGLLAPRPPPAASRVLEFKLHGPILEGCSPFGCTWGPRAEGSQVWGPGGGGWRLRASREPGDPGR